MVLVVIVLLMVPVMGLVTVLVTVLLIVLLMAGSNECMIDYAFKKCLVIGLASIAHVLD